MKYSAALALAVAPLAFAKAIHNVFPVEARGSHHGGNNDNQNNNSPQVVGGTTSIIIIWANPGGLAPTTTLHEAVTVTETVTAGLGEGATAAPVAAIPTHHVTVGGTAGLVYTPAEIQAAVGDMVVFTFLSKNHTATQSSFAVPCEPLEGGMRSGFQPNPDDSIVPAPQVAMQVMTTEPLWFFCAQEGHCGKGMVFSINPTAEKTHAAFQAAAVAQFGAGDGSAIIGSPPAAGNGTATTSVAADPAATATATESIPPTEATGAPSGVETGVGQIQDGQCICAVTCTTGSFPAADVQGVGNFGGFAGSLPRALMES